MTSTELLDSVKYLLRLIAARDWERFRYYALEPSPAHFLARVDVIEQIPEFNGMTLLHVVVRSDPPSELVLDMIVNCPKLIFARDSVGRTPLHVAAGCAAAPSLVKILAHICPAACEIQDEDGYTPLHFACDTSFELFVEDDANKSKTPRVVCYDTVLALLSVSLVCATIEDAEEKNPLEYAIMSNAPLRTVKLLQHAAAKHLRASVPSMIGRRVSLTNSETSIEEETN